MSFEQAPHFELTDLPALFILIVLIIFTLSRILNKTLPKDDELTFVVTFFWLGLFIRISLAFLFDIMKYAPSFNYFFNYLAGDENLWARDGYRLMLLLQGKQPAYIPKGFMGSGQAFLYLNAFTYMIVGYKLIFVKMLNCFAGSMVSIVTYRISSRLFSRDVSLRAFLIVHFFPSLVLWSSIGIRDIWVVLFILLVLDALLDLRVQFKITKLATLLASIYLISELRTGTFICILVAMIPSILFSKSERIIYQFGTLIISGIFFLYLIAFVGIGEDLITSDPIDHMQEIQIDMSGGHSAYFTREELRQVNNPLYLVPMGIIYFLFTPFPWAISKLSHLITLPEMLILFSMIYYFLSSTYKIIKYRYLEAFPLLFFMFFITLAFSMVESNTGTAFRHRAQVLPMFIIISSISMPLLKDRLSNDMDDDDEFDFEDELEDFLYDEEIGENT